MEVKDFGDTTIGFPCSQGAETPRSVAANYSRRMLGRADNAGFPLSYFYAGKTSVYALDPFDPREWYPESLMRFRKHHAAGAGYKFTFIVATYLIQDDALATEKYLAAELGAATGLLRLNAAPYRTGRLNKAGADGYAVYIQAK